MLIKNKNMSIPMDLYEVLLKLSKFRGVTIPELLREFIDNEIDEFELMEIDFEEYTSGK